MQLILCGSICHTCVTLHRRGHVTLSVAVTDWGCGSSDGKRARAAEAVCWSTATERWRFWTTQSV